jgi:activator of HSP90 ATPase
MPRRILQRIVLAATPRDIYSAFMDGDKHAAFTGAGARIGSEVGSRFSAQGGFVTGVNIELVSGRRIVQAWRSNNWPKGAWSMVTIELSRAAKNRTRLVLIQDGVPDKFYAQISEGWKVHYWQPLRKWLAARALARPRVSRRRAATSP